MERFVLVNHQATAASVGDTAHDVAGWPVSNFLGFTDETTDSKKLTLMFKPMEESIGSDIDGNDYVVLTITDNQQVKVMQDIIAVFNGHKHRDGVILLGDASTGEFLTSDITGVQVGVQSAS